MVIHFFLSGPLEIDSWRLLFVGKLFLFLLVLAEFRSLAIFGYGLLPRWFSVASYWARCSWMKRIGNVQR